MDFLLNDQRCLQVACECQGDNPQDPLGKFQALRRLYENCEIEGATFVFCNTRRTAESIYKLLKDDGFEPLLIIGGGGKGVDADRQRAERQANFKLFKEDTRYNVCIATDGTMGKGVDVPRANMVINYDLPRFHDPNIPRDRQNADLAAYCQRQGRATRGEATGVCVNLVDSTDAKELERMTQIQNGCQTPHRPQPGFEPHTFPMKDPQTQQAVDVIGKWCFQSKPD